jgi:hypothetical protein
MVYFENQFRWSFFHHNFKMHGPNLKKYVIVLRLVTTLTLMVGVGHACETVTVSP